MKSKILTMLFCFGILPLIITGQPFAKWDQKSLALKNGVVERVIRFDEKNFGIVSNSMKLIGDNKEFLIAGSPEFSFTIDGEEFTGLRAWKLVSIKQANDGFQGDGATVLLEMPEKKLQISVTYLLYPKLPLIRKKISFNNLSGKEIKLESLDIECLLFEGSGVGTECWVMDNYGRQKSLSQFIGNWYDPVVVVHQTNKQNGIVLGNEAPGVMKRTTAFLQHNLLTIGLTHPEQNFGFRQWIKPGETWESTWTFSAIYSKTDDPYLVLNTTVNDYVRKHLGTRLAAIPKKPVFIYNTWEPFFNDINEKLIYELVDAAAECGFEEFIIDGGWEDSYGDWGSNKEKFPNGLKPVFDYIKSKGMKPGLWISLAAAGVVSNAYKQNPDWLVRKADGSPISLHADTDKMYDWETYSMCMTTSWKDYIKGIILNLVKEHGLEYIKADFAAVTGAYTTDKTRSGCHATNHTHKDRNESMLEMYQATWQLFDELHQEAPNLFIDCTFETMGYLQLIDLDMCKHAEGNWLSNFGEPAPTGSLRVRQMGWWRTPVIPATAMVIGNQHLDDPEFLLSLKSLAGTLPIVLGDPRKLNKEQRSNIKKWADWPKTMQNKHDFMTYRQDLSGFGEPMEGMWDGYQRINSDTKSGGIVGVFRQGAKEQQRSITVQYLDSKSQYKILSALDGKMVAKMSGKELADIGFQVKFEKVYDGGLFEITKVE